MVGAPGEGSGVTTWCAPRPGVSVPRGADCYDRGRNSRGPTPRDGGWSRPKAPAERQFGDPMFDGRWRSTFEKGLRPVGAQIRRTGITANHLTLTGLAIAVAASLTSAHGWPRRGAR